MDARKRGWIELVGGAVLVAACGLALFGVVDAAAAAGHPAGGAGTLALAVPFVGGALAGIGGALVGIWRLVRAPARTRGR